MKNKIFEINEKIKVWNIGTLPDLYLYSYVELYEDNHDKPYLGIKELEIAYKKFRNKDELSKNTISQLVAVFIACNLIKELKKGKYELIFRLDAMNEFDLNNYLKQNMKDKNFNLLNKKSEQFWFSILITNCYHKGELTLGDITSLDGQKGYIKESFIRIYFKNSNKNNPKCSLTTFFDSEIKDSLLNELSDFKYEANDYYFDKKADNILVEKQKEVIPLDVNIDGNSKRDQVLQAKFRSELIAEANMLGLDGCWLCGKHNIDLLEAAHIIAHAKGGSFDKDNGLLLCSSHHKAYDANYFSFNQVGETVISPSMAKNVLHCDLDHQLDKKVLNEARLNNLRNIK